MAQVATILEVVRTSEVYIRRGYNERDRDIGYGDSRSIVFVLM